MSGFSVRKKARLLELINNEIELFGRMRLITEKQAELIETDDIAAFDETLDRRQELIEEINGLHQESDDLMQSYISYADSSGGESIGELDEAIARLRGAIEGCAEMNDKITEAAKIRALQYTERIGSLNLSRESLGRYQQKLPNNPKMFDKMS